MDHQDDHWIRVLNNAEGGVTTVTPLLGSAKAEVGEMRKERENVARGMVTAEIALACLGAVMVLVLLAGVVYLGILQMRLGDSVTETARQAARGDASAVSRAQEGAPAGTQFTVREHNGEVHVRAEYRHSTPVGELPLSAEAWVVAE